MLPRARACHRGGRAGDHEGPPININIRRGEGGATRRGGPSWSPVGAWWPFIDEPASPGEPRRATMKAIKAAPRIHPAALAPTGNLRTSSFFPSSFLHLMPIGLSHYQDSEAGDRRLRSVVGICVTNSWERAAVRGIARPSAHAAANDSSPMLERAADTACP